MHIDVSQLITLVVQGIIVGVTILWVTKKLQDKKEKKLLQKHSLLVYLEVNCHIAILNDIASHNAIPEMSASFITFDDDTWKSSQEHLTKLPIDHLIKIGAYYQSIISLDTLMSEYAGQSLIPQIKYSVATSLKMAIEVNKILESYWKKN